MFWHNLYHSHFNSSAIAVQVAIFELDTDEIHVVSSMILGLLAHLYKVQSRNG
jgi:hypothetical protein